MRSPALLDRASVLATALVETAAALLPVKAVPTSFPAGADELSPEKLTSLLSAAAHAHVRSARRIGGTTGTTDRVVLQLDWDRDDSGLPGRIFVKSTPLSAKNRTMVAALSLARNEINFYRQIRPSLSAHAAPVAYAAESAIGARHLLLLEDITAKGGQPQALCHDVDVDYARAMMASLAELHAAFWESPRLDRDLRWVRPERGRPGFALLLRQFRRVRKQLLKSHHDSLPAPVRAMAEFVNTNTGRYTRSGSADLRPWFTATVIWGTPTCATTVASDCWTGRWSTALRVCVKSPTSWRPRSPHRFAVLTPTSCSGYTWTGWRPGVLTHRLPLTPHGTPCASSHSTRGTPARYA